MRYTQGQTELDAQVIELQDQINFQRTLLLNLQQTHHGLGNSSSSSRDDIAASQENIEEQEDVLRNLIYQLTQLQQQVIDNNQQSLSNWMATSKCLDSQINTPWDRRVDSADQKELVASSFQFNSSLPNSFAFFPLSLPNMKENSSSNEKGRLEETREKYREKEKLANESETLLWEIDALNKEAENASPDQLELLAEKIEAKQKALNERRDRIEKLLDDSDSEEGSVEWSLCTNASPSENGSDNNDVDFTLPPPPNKNGLF